MVKDEDVGKILTDWKFDQKTITDYDGSGLSEENKKTVLTMRSPKEDVKSMRATSLDKQYKENYHNFEQELYNRMAQRM